MKYKLITATVAALVATVAWATIVAVNGNSRNFTTLFGAAGIAGAYPSCAKSSSGGVTTITPPLPGENCNIQPDAQTISIYRLALCTSKPSAPTTSAVSSTSTCEFFYETNSLTGSSVSIVLNANVALPAGVSTKPANNTYTHLYVEIDPEVKIKSAVKFNQSMGDSNGLSTGAHCWSILATTYNFSMNMLGSMPQATACGSSAPVSASVEATSLLYNSMMDDSGLSGGTGFTNAFINLPTTAGGVSTLDAYLIGADKKLVATQTVNTIGTVKRVVGIMTLPGAGVVVSAGTTNFVLGFNNTLGAQVSTQSGSSPSRVSKFGNGPFDMTVTVN